MQTLRYLNGVSTSPVTFTDYRGTNVIFDRTAGKSYSFTETSLSFNLLVGANIVDIINPSSANVRYKINIGTTQATLSFGTLPSGVTVSQAGTIYTVYGIDSLSDWEAVKQPTVTIDPSFAGTFSYEAAVVYNTDTAADIEFEWTVGVYLPTAQLSSAFTIDITPSYTRGGVSNMVAVFNWTDFIYDFIYRGNFTMIAAPRFTWDLNKTLSTTATMSCVGTRYIDFGTYNYIPISSSSSVDERGIYIDVADGKLAAQKEASVYNVSTTVYNLPSLTSFTSYGGDFYPNTPVESGTSFARAANRNAPGGGTWAVYYGASSGSNYGTIISEKIGPNSFNNYDNTTFTSSSYFMLSPGVVTGASHPYAVSIASGTMSVYSLQPNPVYTTFEYSVSGLASQVGQLMDVSNDYIVLARPNVASNRNVYVYDITDGTLLQTFTHGANVQAISLYGNSVCVSSTTDTKIYNIDTGATDLTISQGTSTYFSYQTSQNSLTDLYVAIADPDEVSGSSRGVVRIYQRATGTLHATLVNPNVETTSNVDMFGGNVHIDEDYCVVSAAYEDYSNLVPDKGTVYVYT